MLQNSPVGYDGGSVRAGVAQLVEHLICNQTVGGSIPSASSTTIPEDSRVSRTCQGNRLGERLGSLEGPVEKPAGEAGHDIDDIETVQQSGVAKKQRGKEARLAAKRAGSEAGVTQW